MIHFIQMKQVLINISIVKEVGVKKEKRFLAKYSVENFNDELH